MAKVIVTNHMTLDGVMQAPGRPDEDSRDGFEHHPEYVASTTLSEPLPWQNSTLLKPPARSASFGSSTR